MAKRVGDPKAASAAHAEKRAVLSLLQNRTFVELIKAVDVKYVRRMRAANTADDRDRAWGVLRALDALYVEMKARIDRGTTQEKLDQEVRRRQEAGGNA